MKLLKLHSGKKLNLYSASYDHDLSLPMLPFSLSAGFPSPALDFVDISIDLNKHLIDHPSATYYGRVQGESMKDAGINDGDLIIIDRSIEPIDGKIAVCFLDGEFTLKRIHYKGRELWLMPENNKYKAIKVEEENQLIIWGVVTYVIKKTL